jgi:hypothetical protein
MASNTNNTNSKVRPWNPLWILFLGLVFIPFRTSAAVLINEIAWIGTASSSADEWIELKNTGTGDVDLAGWKLAAADDVPTISLAGSVRGGGFFLLERTNDATLPDIIADQIYAGALSNNGEKLVLKNAQGIVEDTVDASRGWPAGDNTTKKTMQRSASGWITASATPRAENAVLAAAPVTKPTPARKTSAQNNSDPQKQIQNLNPLPVAPNVAAQLSNPVAKTDRNLYAWLFGSVGAGLLVGLALVYFARAFNHRTD